MSDSKRARDSYLFRLVLPAAEIAGWPEIQSTQLPIQLAVHLLWCFTWRTVDDALDCPNRSSQEVLNIIIAHSDAIALTVRHHPAYSPTSLQEINNLQSICFEIAHRERKSGIGVNEAWKRCSQLFIVPNMLWQFSQRQRDAYQRYINLIGLTHDIQDLLSDIKLGINTPPVRWLWDVDAYFAFRPKMTKPWFRRASVELEQVLNQCLKIALPEWKMFQQNVIEAADLLEELRSG
jgi:hypothetical protein